MYLITDVFFFNVNCATSCIFFRIYQLVLFTSRIIHSVLLNSYIKNFRTLHFVIISSFVNVCVYIIFAVPRIKNKPLIMGRILSEYRLLGFKVSACHL
jgi:hypothetical protein